MQLDPWSTSFLLGGAQGVFLALALLNYHRESSPKANRYLALFVLLASLDLIDGFFHYTRFYYQYPVFIGLFTPLIFLYGPLLFFYVAGLCDYTPNKKFALHLSASFMATLLLIPFFNLPDSVKISIAYSSTELFRDVPILASISITLVLLFCAFHPAVYLLKCLTILRFHQTRIESRFSYKEKVNLRWLSYILVVVSILWVFHFINIFLGDMGGLPIERISYLLIVLLIYTMGFIGLRQPIIFEDNNAEHQPTVGKSKYQRSALDEAQISMISEELTKIMRERKLYLNHQLTLAKLSGETGYSTHYLSQVINERHHKNFFDYINELRIERAKNTLAEENMVNVTKLAQDVGFNSKSAFYSAFKKQTGMTPLQFKNTLKKTDSLN